MDYSVYPGHVADEAVDELWQYRTHPYVVATNFIGARKRDNGRPRPIKLIFFAK